MDKITLSPIDIEHELPEILNWDNKFAGTEAYSSIEKYIFEDWLIHGMSELIDTNYEQFPIGEDERKFLLVAKDKTGTIVGFTIQSVFNLSSSPEVFLQYIVIRPDMQKKGIGTQILKALPKHIESELGKRPCSIFSYIHKENFPSQKLYEKLGYSFKYEENYVDYLKAFQDEPEFGKNFD